MQTTNRQKTSSVPSNQRIQRALVAISALLLLQGCKTMEVRAQALGEGIVRAAQINHQNRVNHQRLVDWQNAQPQSQPLPWRQPAASQPVITQPVAPAYSNNPSQVFLQQGMWQRPGN